ncbi:MAG: exopolysaccharide biosynthesis protein [Akkermansiaceae bacterium]|nr:exopolysaccharide biosynthesis protein [Akkermansiaceae bacterium]
MEKQPENLEELLERIGGCADGKDKVKVDDIMDAVGGRSFGPLLLLAGVFVSAPGIADIPGVPTVIGLFVLTISVQLISGNDHFWLPRWLLDRKIKSETIRKMTGSKWVKKPAAFIDRLLKERLRFLTGKPAMVAIATVTAVTMLVMPLTEVVPLSANVVGAGAIAFGLSLIAKDGVMALAGFVISAAAVTLAIMGVT